MDIRSAIESAALYWDKQARLYNTASVMLNHGADIQEVIECLG